MPTKPRISGLCCFYGRADHTLAHTSALLCQSFVVSKYSPCFPLLADQSFTLNGGGSFKSMRFRQVVQRFNCSFRKHHIHLDFSSIPLPMFLLVPAAFDRVDVVSQLQRAKFCIVEKMRRFSRVALSASLAFLVTPTFE